MTAPLAVRGLVTGIQRIPAAVFSCVLDLAGSRDLGALAAVSVPFRQSVIGHILRAKVVTLDVCADMYTHGHARTDALRGCAIRGIRLVTAHLAVATHIRKRPVCPPLNDVDTAFAKNDATHILNAAAAIVARNAATLQSVDINEFSEEDARDEALDSQSGCWYTSDAVMVALLGCRRLTSLDMTDRDRTLDDGEPGWIRAVIHTIVERNDECMDKLTAHLISPPALSLALARLPLKQLSIFFFDDRANFALLAGCTTLEKLWFGEMPDSPTARGAVASALTALTNLTELHVDGHGTGDAKALPWCFPASLARLDVQDAFDAAMPDMAGGSLVSLKLERCDPAFTYRLVRGAGSTLRELELASTRSRLAPEETFCASLPSLLPACPSLTSLVVGGDSAATVAPSTLLELVRVCPLLAVMDVQIAASFQTRHLAALLEATQGRLRALCLYYAPSDEYNIWLNGRSNPDDDGYDDANAGVEVAAARLKTRGYYAPLLLPHLISLVVPACSDRFLRLLRCPMVGTLVLRGVRVRLDDPVPPPASFPSLETLNLRVSAAVGGTDSAVDGHVRLRSLSLSWDSSATSEPEFGSYQSKCDFDPATLSAILDRCPGVTRLTFDDDTPAAPILAALADPRFALRPSRLTEVVILSELEASDGLLEVVLALRARHPRLERVNVPLPDELDPRIRAALSDQ